MLERPPQPLPTEAVTTLTQAVYREARLLDEERYDEWLALLSEDIVYRMALAGRRFRTDRSPPTPVGRGTVFDDDFARLKLRIDRLQSGLVWAENPRNFVRRAVSNVEVYSADAQNEARVHSVIVIHRNRIDGITKLLTAGRKDIWREDDDGWLLAARDIALNHAVLPDSNLNVFF